MSYSSVELSKYLSFLETPLGKSLFPDLHFEIGSQLLFDLEEWKIRSDQQDLIIRFTHEITKISENYDVNTHIGISDNLYVNAIHKMNLKETIVFLNSIKKVIQIKYDGDITDIYEAVILIFAIGYHHGAKAEIINILTLFENNELTEEVDILVDIYESSKNSYDPEDAQLIEEMLIDLQNTY